MLMQLTRKDRTYLKANNLASLDLTSAFDLVNIELLMKRLRIIGLPNDLINLIQIWLSDRTYYVTAKGTNSFIRLTNIGTIQGSILGPLLYAIYVAPLQDLYEITMFADDNYPLASDSNLERLITEFTNKLNTINQSVIVVVHSLKITL